MARHITNRLIQRVRRHQNITTLFRSTTQGQPVGMVGASMSPSSGELSRLVMGQMPEAPTALANGATAVSDEMSTLQLPLSPNEHIASLGEIGRSSEPSQSARQQHPAAVAPTTPQNTAPLQRAIVTRKPEPANIAAQWPDRANESSSSANQQMSNSDEEKSLTADDVTAHATVTSVTPPVVQLSQEPTSPATSVAGEPETSRKEPTSTEQAEDDRTWSRLKVIQQAHARKQIADETPVQRNVATQDDTSTSNVTKEQAQPAPHSLAVQKSQDNVGDERGQAVTEEHQQPATAVPPATPTTVASSEDASVDAVQDDKQATNLDANTTIASHPNQQAVRLTGADEQKTSHAPGQQVGTDQPSISSSGPAQPRNTESRDTVVDATSLNSDNDMTEANLSTEPELAAEPEPDRPSLDQVWPVQRTPEPSEQSTADKDRPGVIDAAGGSTEIREGRPNGEHAAEQDHLVNDTVQATLQKVPPARNTESAIHMMAPRRPRPVRQRRELQQDPPQDLKTKPATDSVDVEQQKSSAIQAKTAEYQPGQVTTEIGELPSDLWSLIDEPLPAHHEHKSSTAAEAEKDTTGETFASQSAHIVEPRATGVAPEVQKADFNQPTPSDPEPDQGKDEATDIEALGVPAVNQLAVDTPHANVSADSVATAMANVTQRTASDEAINPSGRDSTIRSQSILDEEPLSESTSTQERSVTDALSTIDEESMDIPSSTPLLQNRFRYDHTTGEAGTSVANEEAAHNSDNRSTNHPIQRHAIGAIAPMVMKATLSDEDASTSSTDDSLSENGAVEDDSDLDLAMDDSLSNELADDGADKTAEDEDAGTEENEKNDEDISELARQVYAYLQRRLVVERERMG